jgi:beta-lactam-binding protein with PASTA domain
MSGTIVTQRDPLLEEKIVLPDVRSMPPDVARSMLESMGLMVQAFGSGRLVVRQKPDPGQFVEKGDLVNVALASSDQSKDGSIRIPDVRGLTIRRAMNRLVVDDFDIVVDGSGIVRRQFPRAGTKGTVGSTVTLTCVPEAANHAVLY